MGRGGGGGGERGEKDWNKTKANKERKTVLLRAKLYLETLKQMLYFYLKL